MENLLAMPVRPIEVMLAKIVPYIVIGYVQVVLIVVSGLGVWYAGARLDPLAERGARPVHREQSGVGVHVLHAGAQSDAGDPDGAVHAVAVVPVVRLHVSVPGMPIWAQRAGEVFP